MEVGKSGGRRRRSCLNTEREIEKEERMKKVKGGGGNGLFPNSLKMISSCLKAGASVASSVRSAGASVASSISTTTADAYKDQVLWAGFDKVELGKAASKNVLLLGYTNGFQVLDVEDAANVTELVSKRDGPVTFLQMKPLPAYAEGDGGSKAPQPLLVIVAGDASDSSDGGQVCAPARVNNVDFQSGNCVSPTAVRFYSLRSHTYIHVLRFRSAVYMVRCSPRIIAVGLSAQIYCFDALTLQSKFSVLTYPVPQVGGLGWDGVNIGYGPMAVGPRWLAYASNNPLVANMGRLSPQNLTPSPGVSPSTSPGNGSLVARYAMESSKQLASGIINLGDIGYKRISKYCQELMPDGPSSPVSSNSSLKFGRVGSLSYPVETDNAGVVVIKDFVSGAVISQFKAHNSPISALCFDPSGTLLVTASVHGNNINIFRIMPSSVQSGSGSSTYDWSSSHVHLYKLYRGITTAVIQDICFSHFSQWVAIISSKGTCHIFLLSPFGGDTSIQTQNARFDTPTTSPGLSLPWWSTASGMLNQQSCAPPQLVTLSVVSRIKNGNSGWFNGVGNVAAYTSGKASTPTGVLAAVFHNCISQSLESSASKVNALEHLLVYTPCGHLVQHELILSLGAEPNDNVSRTGPNSLVQTHNEESRVKVEPVQWWHVCRQSDWPEREENVSGFSCISNESGDVVMDTFDCEVNGKTSVVEFNDNVVQKGFVKTHGRPHWYLSNAEVQINSGRFPVWQKSKVSFHVMRVGEKMFHNGYASGEFEVEKVPVHEVEVKRKDLLPVFDHFHNVKSDWNDRVFARGRYTQSCSYGLSLTKDEFKEEIFGCNSKVTSLGSVGGSDAGSSRTSECLLDLDPMKRDEHENSTMTEINGGNRDSTVSSLPPSPLEQCVERDHLSSLLHHCDTDNSHVGTSCTLEGVYSLNCSASSGANSTAENVLFTQCSGRSDVFTSSGGLSLSLNNNIAEVLEHVDSNEPLDFGEYFQEGYYGVSELNESQNSGELVTDANSSSSPCEKEKHEEDEESDDMLGCVFAFSEEG